LITVRALDILKNADVVLYDRLVDPALLLETGGTCELVDVGKSAGDHAMPQQEITRLLISYGQRGGTVVRLKSGDPFLFGRGGEEAEALADAGIPFAVVPGVSALQAAAAYAGIPLTHRAYASSLGVATGHGADGTGGGGVRWRSLAEAVDTVVVFMGVSTLDTVTAELMAGGMDPKTPAAVIERGASPLQRVIGGTLAAIAGEARAARVQPPSLFVCGETAALASRLGWYRPGPLSGLRIGITRPFRQSGELARLLRGMGAQPLPMPAIAMTDRRGEDVGHALASLDEYAIVAFVSANGVSSFFRALGETGRDARALAGKTVAAIGPATAGALRGAGITADVQARTFIAEGLVEALLEQCAVAGKRVLLVRSNLGRNTVAERLAEAGALVDQASFYETRPVRLRPYALALLSRGEIDIVTFTSASTVDGFFPQVDRAALPGTVRFASIGPETSAAIRKSGFEPSIEAAEYTAAGLAEAILQAETKAARA
jgi:uroporphyrinogen III methyltransferase/synthase